MEATKKKQNTILTIEKGIILSQLYNISSFDDLISGLMKEKLIHIEWFCSWWVWIQPKNGMFHISFQSFCVSFHLWCHVRFFVLYLFLMPLSFSTSSFIHISTLSSSLSLFSIISLRSSFHPYYSENSSTIWKLTMVQLHVWENFQPQKPSHKIKLETEILYSYTHTSNILHAVYSIKYSFDIFFFSFIFYSSINIKWSCEICITCNRQQYRMVVYLYFI